VHHVLETHHLNHRRAPVYKSILGPIVGNGLVISEGEVWRRQRRLLQPSFHPDLIRGLSPAMVQEIAGRRRCWPRGGEAVVLDMYREMMDLSLRIAARTMFSNAVDGDIQTISQEVWTLNEHLE
jgi:cytochrome P450